MGLSSSYKYAPSPKKRKKHRGSSPRAVIRIEGGLKVGKCSAEITEEMAQDLLNAGHPYRSRRSAKKKYPERIYNVYDGVPYRAQHTNGGDYHGFPVHPDELDEIPTVQKALEEIARQQGELDELRAWLDGGWRGEDQDNQ